MLEAIQDVPGSVVTYQSFKLQGSDTGVRFFMGQGHFLRFQYARSMCILLHFGQKSTSAPVNLAA
jgi:hypothetical protein